MNYFKNDPYTLYALRREFGQLYQELHPKNGGNYEEYKAFLDEYNQKRKKLQNQKKWHAIDAANYRETTIDNTPPAEGLTLEPIANGVAVMGDSVTTFKHHIQIALHGGIWNKELQLWVAYNGTDIKALCDWFGIDYEGMKLRIEDSTIPTLRTLTTMVEKGKDTSNIKRVKVGRFRCFQDFMAFFKTHYLPAVENLSKGIILQKDMTLLRYFADDMLMSFGFDTPDEDTPDEDTDGNGAK